MSYDHDKQCQDNNIVVDPSSEPSPGSAVVVVTVRIMSGARTPASQCYGLVPCTSCSNDCNLPMSIRRSATGWRHRRLFGETLRVSGDGRCAISQRWPQPSPEALCTPLRYLGLRYRGPYQARVRASTSSPLLDLRPRQSPPAPPPLPGTHGRKPTY